MQGSIALNYWKVTVSFCLLDHCPWPSSFFRFRNELCNLNCKSGLEIFIYGKGKEEGESGIRMTEKLRTDSLREIGPTFFKKSAGARGHSAVNSLGVPRRRRTKPFDFAVDSTLRKDKETLRTGFLGDEADTMNCKHFLRTNHKINTFITQCLLRFELQRKCHIAFGNCRRHQCFTQVTSVFGS
jgi:hypothetical protein